MPAARQLVHRVAALAIVALLPALSGCGHHGGPQVAGHGPDTPSPAARDAHGRGTLLIAYAGPLAEAADRWAEYRRAQGWEVRTHTVGDGEPATVRATLLAAIRDMARDELSYGRLAVLLLGDAGRGGIPTWHFTQRQSVVGSSTPRTRCAISSV